MIDWLSFVEKLAVIFAAVAAMYGVDSWKREATWKRKNVIKEEVLSLFYEVRDAIEYIRNPFSSTEEGKTRKSTGKETEEEKKILDRAYTVFERYENKKVVFTNLRKRKYRFMAIYGNVQSKPFDDIYIVMNEIFLSASMLGQYYWQQKDRNSMTNEEKKTHLADLREKEAILWAGYKVPDTIRDRVDKIIENIEQVCSNKTKNND